MKKVNKAQEKGTGKNMAFGDGSLDSLLAPPLGQENFSDPYLVIYKMRTLLPSLSDLLWEQDKNAEPKRRGSESQQQRLDSE